MKQRIFTTNDGDQFRINRGGTSRIRITIVDSEEDPECTKYLELTNDEAVTLSAILLDMAVEA